MTDLAKNIKRLRQANNMTQSDLADKLHVTRQTVSSWERSNSTPDLTLLPSIAEALGTDQTGLLYPDEAQRKQTPTIGCGFVIGYAMLYATLLLTFVSFGGGFFGAMLLAMTGLIVFIGLCTGMILEAIAEK